MCQATPKKSDPNAKFIISDSGPYGDNSYVCLRLDSMEKIGLHEGDLVHIVEPSRRHDTLAILLVDESIAEPQIVKMNHICRKNLAAEVGEFVKIKIFEEAVDMKKVVVKKIGGQAPNATPENHEQNGLVKYFGQGIRPICRDDVFEIKTHLGTMEFMITCTEPAIYGFVTADTMIAIDWAKDQIKAN